MARLTVEDCLDTIPNRFNLILAAGKRAHQLAKGAEAKVPLDNDKPTVVALRELANGYSNAYDEALAEAKAQEEADLTLQEEARGY